MNLRLFIERPILSGVVSAIIVVLGVISYFALPVEQYPDIAPPTIRVTANYTGASAETIQKGVIVPLEEAINGVENMIYMTSEASNAGFASITVYFKQGTDPDMAAVNVQNRVQRATGQLPAEVTRVGVTVAKRQTSMLQVFALYSPDDSYDMNFLANYVNITMKPEILRISGVGELNVLGNDYSMRVWLKPDIMAQYGLVPSDITRVLEEQNIEVAAGVVGENSDEMQQYTLKYKGRLLTAEEFEEIVIRSTDNGLVLKLKDVADIELGRVNYNYTSTYDGHPGVTCMVYQTPGSNATEVNEQVTAFLEKASESLPKGLAVETLRSTNEYLYASINEVVETLIIAIILVVLVIYMFLQDIRSTVIPAVSIFVSLIGTLAFIYAVGYSINLITLFALVLVIGTVVDDAIVVVEAVQERFDAGYRSSYLASIDAMKNVQSAIIVSSLVFMSVFIPVSFMGGTSGTFYTQFGLTMAVAVGISAINALTLSPALCALILRPYKDEAGNQRQNFAYRFRKAFYAVFDIMAEKYRNGVIFFMHRKWMIWSLIGLSVILLVLFVRNTKTGLVPQEDLAYVNANVSTSPGSSLYFTSQVMDSIGKRLERIPQVDHAVIISGWGMISGGSSSAGTVMLKLKPWNERTKKGEHANDVIQQIYSLTADIKDAAVFATSPGMIPGYGTGNSLDLNLQDLAGGDIETFTKVVNDYTEALRKRPEIARAYSSFSLDYPQWEIELDAAKCKRAGISPDEVLATLGLNDLPVPDLGVWKEFLHKLRHPAHEVNIALVGKYVELQDAYKSIQESFIHAGAAAECKVKVHTFHSEHVDENNVDKLLHGMDGILVAPGFGERGLEGKITAIRYAREHGVPFFGICLGMQMCVVEFARNVLGLKDAASTEVRPNTTAPVINLMEDQKSTTIKGGTMRLGAYECELKAGTLARRIYGKELISERHRHRYEFNNDYLQEFESAGLIASGFNPQTGLVEIVELPSHPFFIGVQFHPEYKSTPEHPQPIFVAFVKAAIVHKERD